MPLKKHYNKIKSEKRIQFNRKWVEAMQSVAKTDLINNLVETESHYTELKAVQAARISTFGIALLTTVLVLFDQFVAALYRVENEIHDIGVSLF